MNANMKILLLTNKNTAPILVSTRKTKGAASCPATERRGKEDFCFRANNRVFDQIPALDKARVFSCREAWRWSPLVPRVHSGFFICLKTQKNQRRHTMPKNWEPPRTLQNAADTLENLSALLQFVKDLTAMPTKPADQYDFSDQGYYGLYLFTGFVQDTLNSCMDCIHRNSL